MRDGNRTALSAAAFAGFLVVAWLQVLVVLLAVLLVLDLLPGSAAVAGRHPAGDRHRRPVVVCDGSRPPSAPSHSGRRRR